MSPRKTTSDLKTFLIALISANAFYYNIKKASLEFFTTSLYKINRFLNNYKEDPKNAALVASWLLRKYTIFNNIFSKTAANKLLEYYPYNYKIQLTEPLLH